MVRGPAGREGSSEETSPAGSKQKERQAEGEGEREKERRDEEATRWINELRACRRDMTNVAYKVR